MLIMGFVSFVSVVCNIHSEPQKNVAVYF